MNMGKRISFIVVLLLVLYLSSCQNTTCTLPFVLNTTSNVCICPTNFTYNSTANTCICPTNFTFNSTAVTCGCLSGFTYNPTSHTCLCMDNATYNSTDQTCTCKDHFTYNSTLKTCTCGVKNFYNSTEKSCTPCGQTNQTTTFYYRYYQMCQKDCSSLPNINQSSVQIGCSCSKPFVFNVASFECEINCKLVQNSTGNKKQNETCECNPKYQFDTKTNKCKIICSNTTDPNIIMLNNSLLDYCVCKPGYEWVDYSCVSMSSNTVTIGLIAAGSCVGLLGVIAIFLYPKIFKSEQTAALINRQPPDERKIVSSNELLSQGVIDKNLQSGQAINNFAII